MKIIIYKEQGNQEKEIARIPFAIKQPKELLLKAEEIVNYAISQNGDILGIGALSKVASCCLTTCFEDGSVYDTMVVPQNCMSVYYHNSSVHGQYTEYPAGVRVPAGPVFIEKPDKEKLPCKFSVRLVAYQEGYAISVGKKDESSFARIYGASSDLYFHSVSSRNFFMKRLNLCRKFKTHKKVLELLRKDQKLFHCLVQKNGYHFSIVPCNPYFITDEKDRYSKLSSIKKQNVNCNNKLDTLR